LKATGLKFCPKFAKCIFEPDIECSDSLSRLKTPGKSPQNPATTKNEGSNPCTPFALILKKLSEKY